MPAAASLLPLTCEMCHMFQDTLNGSASNNPFFTSVASITVHVKDVDNRPPWFQPCLRTNLGMAKLCVSTGYRGRVNLTEKEVSDSSPHSICPNTRRSVLEHKDFTSSSFIILKFLIDFLTVLPSQPCI